MCNDLVWAVSGRQFPELPSFTERVNAADGGIDAEWEVEIADNNNALPTPIVGPGWNVFQTLLNPALLTNELISWLLLGYREKSNSYFFLLGNQDSQGLLCSKIEEIGSQTNGANAFAEYWGGWAKRDRAQAEKRLIELVNMNAVTSEAFASAAGYLGPSEALVTVIKERVATRLIAPKLASGIPYGDWIGKSTNQQFLDLLKEIAGDQFENSALAIDVLGRWLLRDRLLEGELAEFAWRCLESIPSITSTSREAYDLEALAAKLSESNIDRGFRLLEKLLRRPYDRNFWNPIDRYGVQEPKFWNVLHEADSERAIRAVVSAAADSDKRFWVTWSFKDLVNQEKDAEVLLKLAIENEQQAGVIAETVTTSRPGFWPIIQNYREVSGSGENPNRFNRRNRAGT